jgi:hypothetical protein
VLSRPEALASTARFIRYAVDANKGRSLKQKEKRPAHLRVFFFFFQLARQRKMHKNAMKEGAQNSKKKRRSYPPCLF